MLHSFSYTSTSLSKFHSTPVHQAISSSMANLVMGAMGNLVPKLYQLLKEEYKLQTGVKERIRSLTKELEVAQAVLCKVSQVPWDQLDKQVQLWACEIREASYDMEDVLDTFFVRVQGPEPANKQEQSLLKHLKKMANIFKKSKARRKICGNIKDIMSHLQEVTERCRRYKVDDIVAKPATVSTIDPRLHAMYTQVNKLVGIDKSSSVIKSMLQLDDMSNAKTKTVSIVGIGGLGKTTLAKAVYDNLRGDFNCRAFISVGRKPDLQKVLQMILVALDKEVYEKFNFVVLQEITQFIEKLREFLQQNKRYLIVIDDLWEKQSWETLKLAVIGDNKSSQGRIIITTRKWEVASGADEVYQLPPLPLDSSRKLFFTRIYGDERKCVDYQPDEVSDEILKKCAGIPLAIITMASLLVDEPRDRWFEVYKSIGFGCKEEEGENTMKKILSFSYYDLPSHLRACLLYLSAYPEDFVIPKIPLVWMCAAEGFVRKREGKGLFETGEGYFNDLINRSLIQEVEGDFDYVGFGVHDMVLDFIRSMSCEENFFTVLDNNDQGILVPRNVVHRLADHNKTMVPSNQADMFDMLKVRSFIALNCDIDNTWAPVSSFKLLRVLNVGQYSNITATVLLGLEPLGQLFHLRFLGINRREIKKIPKEIGALKMLQTLDLWRSWILEVPSNSSLPTQLLCLRIVYSSHDSDVEMFSMGRLTSLEELSIYTRGWSKDARRFLKELGNLRELRVLNAIVDLEDDEETKRDMLESVHHLYKLQHLSICCLSGRILFRRQELEFVLPGDLRYLELHDIVLWKLPSCIDPLCHRKLSHLDLWLQYMDEQELKTLGGLPELHYLGLDLRGTSATMRDISDSDATYFPKLRSLKLRRSLALFVANKGNDGKKSISFHIWDGKVDDSITKQPSASDSKLQGNDESSSVFQWETGRGLLGERSDEELQLLSASISDEGEHAATPRFMPSLQVLDFCVRMEAVQDHPNCCDRLGLELLSSLQEIRVSIEVPADSCSMEGKEVEEALSSAAQVHPNHPTLHIKYW